MSMLKRSKTRRNAATPAPTGRLWAALLTAALAVTTFAGVTAPNQARADIDEVSKAIDALTKLEDEAFQISKDIDAARTEQSVAERRLRTAEADLEEQQQIVDQMRTVVARVAIAQQQQQSGLDVAGWLFSSPDDDTFLRDMATAQSVAVITGEQMTRFKAENARLNELQKTQAQAISDLDTQINKQTALKADYDVRVDQARQTVNKLSADQVKQIEQIKDAKIREESTRQLASALAESAASRSGMPAGQLGSAKAIRPTDGPMTSPFGYRTNPIGGYSELHDGLDIAPPCGTPIRASWTGIVLSSRYEGGWGNRVIIDSGTTRAAYAHMQTLSVQPGQLVEAGQVIGSVGTTGYSTGCHLHFSTWLGETLVDPATLL